MFYHLLKSKFTTSFLGLGFLLMAVWPAVSFLSAAEPSIFLEGRYTSGSKTGQVPSGGLEQNTNLQLEATFDGGSPSLCQTGPLSYQLWRTMAHALGGNTNNLEYLAKGSGDNLFFTYNFNSGPSGQENVYQAIFYCWSSGDNPAAALGTAVQWRSAWFNQTTVGGACNLSSAYWSRSAAKVNEKVEMSVTGTQGCQGRSLTFEIWATGVGGSQKGAVSGAFSSSGQAPFTVKKEWTASQEGEFFFKARVPDPNGALLNSGTLNVSGAASGGGTGTGSASFSFPNPTGVEEVEDLVETIWEWLYTIATPIAVIVIVFAGILMLGAGGNIQRFEQGKKMLTWAVIGLAVIFLGGGLISLVQSFLELGQ